MNEAVLAPTRRKLDVDAYYRMGDAGIIGPEDRTKLIDGEIIDMAPIGQPRAALVGTLAEILVLACAGRAIAWVQNPLWIDNLNVVQPDFTVLRRRATATPPHPAPAPPTHCWWSRSRTAPCTMTV